MLQKNTEKSGKEQMKQNRAQLSGLGVEIKQAQQVLLSKLRPEKKQQTHNKENGMKANNTEKHDNDKTQHEPNDQTAESQENLIYRWQQQHRALDDLRRDMKKGEARQEKCIQGLATTTDRKEAEYIKNELSLAGPPAPNMAPPLGHSPHSHSPPSPHDYGHPPPPLDHAHHHPTMGTWAPPPHATTAGQDPPNYYQQGHYNMEEWQHAVPHNHDGPEE